MQNVGDPNSVLRIACTEVLDTHPGLAQEVARLFLAMFRELQDDQDGNPALTISALPQKLLEVNHDDIFMAYNCLASILPFVHQMDRGSY
jgi:hypothetical protein